MKKPTINRIKPELKMTEFSKQVMKYVKMIPHGRVATYGQIAALAGKPNGARGVGWILNSCAKVYGLPWQRVINSKGKISFDQRTQEYAEQKKLLLKEKIMFFEDDSISLKKYIWKRTVSITQKSKILKNKPQIFSANKEVFYE